MIINQELSRWYRITGGAGHGLSWMIKLLEIDGEVSKRLFMITEILFHGGFVVYSWKYPIRWL